jgi:hypothetical protein
MKRIVLVIAIGAALLVGGHGKAQAACTTDNPGCNDNNCTVVYEYGPTWKGLQPVIVCGPGRF